MKTEKYYYQDMQASRLFARVVEWLPEKRTLVLDRTIAYPEGGGQVADQGVIVWAGQQVRFEDVQKRGGFPLFHEAFPAINVGTRVLHSIAEDDVAGLAGLQPGDGVEVCIDVERREQLSLSHTASHVVFMALEQLRPTLVEGLIGCSIRQGAARFDFLVEERIELAEVAAFEQRCAELVAQDLAVRLFPLEGHDEAWYWQAGDCVMPCGGTHLPSIGAVGPIELSRKRLGKNKERLSMRFPQPHYDLSRYHPAV